MSQKRWFEARGQASPTWHTCLRMGAELRTACGADATCAVDVTRELTRPCYAGRYDREASAAKPETDVRVEKLSPCFWDREPAKAASPADYAQRTCAMVVDARVQPTCVAELREVIRICTEGAPDLTGAGP